MFGIRKLVGLENRGPGRDSHRIRSTVYIPECPKHLSTTQAPIFLDTALRINASKLVRMKGACLFVSGVAAIPFHAAARLEQRWQTTGFGPH
jgi:hypothetical protein